MLIYIEALILYVVLFFSGSTGWFTSASANGFSALRELSGTLLYCLPAIALIWYLLLKAKPASEWKIKPGIKDLVSGAIALPCLLLTGIVTGFVSSSVGAGAGEVLLHSPTTVIGWIILCVSRISAAYLEESYFRFYLLARRDELKLSAAHALAVSVSLFSICHIYEGPWGFLNAVISGTILAFIFLRYSSLHGIAIAHGLYNIGVYVINSLLSQN
jgi:membrane protease YdiL (CAAX protease family)